MTKKFRIWSPYHKKFVIEGAGFGLERLFESIYIKIKGTWSRNQDYETPTNVNSYVVQQWTGLTDSQGVEIYEGDIVTYSPQLNSIKVNCEVVSCVGGFRLARLHSKKGVLLGAFVEVDGKVDSLKIIGNIFQTPELLEKC